MSEDFDKLVNTTDTRDMNNIWNAWLFKRENAILMFIIPLPKVGDIGFYRTITSFEAFRNRELKRCFQPYNRKALDGYWISLRHFKDIQFQYDVPIINCVDLKDFYKKIGYNSKCYNKINWFPKYNILL